MSKQSKASRRQNKSEFIRSQPANMTAKRVVEAAAKQGMKMSVAYVSNIRSSAKRRAGTLTRTPKPAPAAQVPPGSGATSNGEAQLRKLVIQLGVARARALVGEVEAKLEAVIRGQ